MILSYKQIGDIYTAWDVGKIDKTIQRPIFVSYAIQKNMDAIFEKYVEVEKERARYFSEHGKIETPGDNAEYEIYMLSITVEIPVIKIKMTDISKTASVDEMGVLYFMIDADHGSNGEEER